MTVADALHGVGRTPLLEAHDPGAHLSREALSERLRRLDDIRAALSSCATAEELDAAVERALALVPARLARLVELREGGAPVVVAEWPPAARGLAAAGTPAEAALAAKAPVWLESRACSPRLAEEAARLGVAAWVAVPICAGPAPLAVELGLVPAGRLDAAERGYLAVAAGLLGDAAVRARLARVADEGDVIARVRRHAVEMNAVLDAFSVGVALVSSGGEILAINRAAMDLFDLSDADPPRLAPELLARLAMAWPDGRPVQLLETPFRRALRGEIVRDVLLSLAPRGEEGRRWIVAGAAPLGLPGPIHSVVLNVVDVTRSRELEQERASLRGHLVHELAPRLQAIEGRARELQSGAPGAGAGAAGAEILRATRRLAAGLRDLESALTFDADSLRATPELVDVKAFLLDLLERIGGDVDVSRVLPVIPPGLPRALVDPDHLERIVVELLRGALAGAREGTDVALAAEAEEGALRITVASSGQDIAAADLPRVFDRFFRARSRPVGRLHVVRSLAEANGGRATAESGAGRGLAIHVLLPVRAPSPAPPPPAR